MPFSACQAFETTFGLVYDLSSGRYIINETLHKRLQFENSSISFSLSASITGPPIDIILPYVDLYNGKPEIEGTDRYHGEIDGLGILPAETEGAMPIEMQGDVQDAILPA